MDVFQATEASPWNLNFDHMNKVTLPNPEDRHVPWSIDRPSSTVIRSPWYARIGMVVLLSFTLNDSNDFRNG